VSARHACSARAKQESPHDQSALSRVVHSRRLVQAAGDDCIGAKATPGIGYEQLRMRTHFFLYFPREKAARKAGAALGRRGFEVDVREPGQGVLSWAVLASKHLPSSVISLHFGLIEWRLRFLARRLRGEYDGHEADLRDAGP
jgi:hypothetical protein